MLSQPWNVLLAEMGAILIVLLVALLAFTYRQALDLLRPRRRPLEVLPEDVGLTLEEVRIPSPRGLLAAWYLPATNGCTLICCHGIHDNRGQWLRQIALLHARGGYGALLFDFAGHGQSEGSQVTYGLREQEDVAAVVDYLHGRGDVDMECIGLLGYSLGAITGVLAAARMPVFKAVVLESGFADLPRDVGALFTKFTALPAFPLVRLVIFWGQRIASVRLSDIRPARVIGQISPRAVFIISDLKDALANEPYDGEHLYAAAGEPKRFWQVPEAQHVAAFADHPDEWIERVGDFLDTYLAQLASRVARTQHAAQTLSSADELSD